MRNNFIAITAAVASLTTIATDALACNFQDGYTNCGSASPAAAQNAASAAVNNTTQNAATNTSNASGTVTSTQAPAGAGRDNSFTSSVNASGSLNSQSLTVTVTNTSSKPEDFFVCAVIPNVGTFVLGKDGKWTAYTSASTTPSFATIASGQSMTIPVFTNTDTSSIAGTSIYIGAATSSPLQPAGSSWNNMLNNGTYNLAYTIK